MKTPMALAAAGCMALLGCGFDPAATEPLRCPDREGFSVVSPSLERRCGSTKCHGRPAQAYRVMSSFGLRLDAEDKLGTPPTTEAEVDAHFESICLLEPALMARVLEGEAEPAELMLLAKAKDEQKHKGKRIMKSGDNLDRCLSTWLSGDADKTACDSARFEH